MPCCVHFKSVTVLDLALAMKMRWWHWTSSKRNWRKWEKLARSVCYSLMRHFLVEYSHLYTGSVLHGVGFGGHSGVVWEEYLQLLKIGGVSFGWLILLISIPIAIATKSELSRHRHTIVQSSYILPLEWMVNWQVWRNWLSCPGMRMWMLWQNKCVITINWVCVMWVCVTYVCMCMV